MPSAAVRPHGIPLGATAICMTKPACAMDRTNASPPSQGGRFAPFRSIAWYIIFGALHEAAHVAAVLLFGVTDIQSLIRRNGGIVVFLLRTLLGRHCIIPITASVDDARFSSVALVRHSGWMTSLLLALSFSVWALSVALRPVQATRGKNKTSCIKESDVFSHLPSVAWVAFIVAIEAISTDLTGIATPFSVLNGAMTEREVALFCGNFGIILLNPAWDKKALDVLEKMVQVTMMRGAQTGGVVTFVSRDQRHKDQLVGIRSRVVNSKRSDLSKKIHQKVEADAFRARIASLCGCTFASPDLVRTYVGHTRFATSSISSFDGTHPHQWSPPKLQRVYNFSKPADVQDSLRPTEPESIIVENYITHNGDLDFFEVNGFSYGLETVQNWLEIATGYARPSPVDSAAIAGLVDILHTQGCFALSARYAICLGLETSKISDRMRLPSLLDYAKIGAFFETALKEMLEKTGHSLDYISSMPEEREFLESLVLSMLRVETISVPHLKAFVPFLTDEEGGTNLDTFVRVTVDAFFDNDLFNTTKTFLNSARGSFGLGVTSSLSAHRQLCLASRGQTISVAFYPRKGIICYGSEQAAVKAGLGFDTPGGDLPCSSKNHGDKALRLDLDDLNGEICLLDWGYKGDMEPAISPPNRSLPRYTLMNGAVNVVLLRDGVNATAKSFLHKRMTLLEGHEFVKPLPPDHKDPVLYDIQDIPRVCRAIQDDWRGYSRDKTSLNRLTVWNFTKCFQDRLHELANGSIERQAGTIDILLTGCEVSLWLAEQFASDLQKALPKLSIKAISSNKLLGLFGQDLSVPTIGYPMSQKTHDMKGTLMIIVSHSGGTFGPLACSNLLKSITKNLFVVSSEWDTQIGKQLRALHTEDDHVVNSRIFTTDVGVRPAEPCSVSVAATQQLLTNIFEHICIVVLSNPTFRRVTGAVVTEHDLEELERCNQENISALESIVGVDSDGNRLDEDMKRTERELRAAGDVWAEHVLENARAYMMTFIYIFATVVSGYPLFIALATAGGMDPSSSAFYLIRLCDAALYFWFPQLSIIALRVVQKRNLRHRMVGRTVVIGDCPWVSQAAESFLSKIFACSYSIAGLNVLSGNPADHLVHRHTHRVVRGSLLLCGRPDGRLSALTSLETSTCLSVNQASSIQSIGGTCESVTIGHNPFQLPLSARAIFLDRNRPMYLCERVLGELDTEAKLEQRRSADPNKKSEGSIIRSSVDEVSIARLRDSNSRSAASLQGAYLNLAKEAVRGKEAPQKSAAVIEEAHKVTIDDLIEEAIEEHQRILNLRKIFEQMDADGNGSLSLDEFVARYYLVDSTLTEVQVRKIFEEADNDGTGLMNYDKFVEIAEMPAMQMLRMLQSINRPRSLLQVEPSKERYFGETIRKNAPASVNVFSLEKSQHFSMELYESRIATLQRFVAMTVFFHQMGTRVQSFFPRISFGLLGYRMDRTHSITRIQTTASPVSGADVRERMQHLEFANSIKRSIEKISFAWLRHKATKGS